MTPSAWRGPGRTGTAPISSTSWSSTPATPGCWTLPGARWLAPPDWATAADALSGEPQPTGGDGTGDGKRPPHVLLVSSVPWALPPGIHRLQQLVSHLADRSPGQSRLTGLTARAAEWVRRAIDLEHWAAFGQSYERLLALMADRADGADRQGARDGRPGSAGGSTLVLSGDVHFGYIAEVDLGPARRPVHQVVASPLRQVELTYERAGRRLAMSRAGRAILGGLARRSPARTGPVSFQMCHGPVFDNNIATITYTPERATVALDRATMTAGGAPRLDPVGSCDLTE